MQVIRYRSHHFTLHSLVKYAALLSALLCFGTIVIFLSCFEDNVAIVTARCETGAAQRQLKDHVVKLVIVLLSAPENRAQRDAIRSTWLREASGLSVTTMFSVGMNNLSVELAEKLTDENASHNDMMLLSDVIDSYYDLTSKLIESLLWLTSSKISFSYLFKGDDDTYINLSRLYEALLGKPSQRLYWGFFDGRANVKSHGPWSEHDWVLCDRYLPHARGGGYVLSSDLVDYIVRNEDFLARFNSEDISVGAWLGPLRINRVHDSRFDTEYVSRGCNNAYLVMHKQTEEMMKEKYENVQRTGRLCGDKEFRKRLSYEYNWKVKPSLCCIRNDSSVP